MGCTLSEEVIQSQLPTRFLAQVLRNDKLFNHDYYVDLKMNEIVSSMKRRRIKSDTYLFKFNDESNECYVIYRGKVSLMRENGLDLGTLEKGATVGMLVQ